MLPPTTLTTKESLGPRGAWIEVNHRMWQIVSKRRRNSKWVYELRNGVPQMHVHTFNLKGWCNCGVGKPENEEEEDTCQK